MITRLANLFKPNSAGRSEEFKIKEAESEVRSILENLPPIKLERFYELFDADYYLWVNTDVAASGMNPLLHYVTTGWKEGRDPSADFSNNAYLESHPDVKLANIPPLVHFAANGEDEGREVQSTNNHVVPDSILSLSPEGRNLLSAYFDKDYYLRTYQDIARSNINPLFHYVEQGWREGRNPSNDFDSAEYIAAYPDVKSANISPLLHYIQFGYAEGRQIFSRVKVKAPAGFFEATPFAVKRTVSKCTIVVPVYNSPELIDPLFDSLVANTPANVKIIAVNDASPDPRVREQLDIKQSQIKQLQVVHLDKNAGFSGAVNTGIGLADKAHHIVLLNSDVVVPPLWIQRLLQPILDNPSSVGSVTPFSNTSGLTGFPHARNEGPMFLDLPLNKIDGVFRKLDPTPVYMPSFVGFCVAMNRNALKETGVFDEETYQKGYYEDTDLGRRFVEHGFENVISPNLFIYHQEGSVSFSESARIALSSENAKKFNEKFPFYQHVEDQFYADDALRFRRLKARILAAAAASKSKTMVLTHNLGGGSSMYVDRKKKERIKQGGLVCTCVISDHNADIKIEHAQGYETVSVNYYSGLFDDLVEFFGIEQVLLNGLHSAENILGVCRDLTKLESKTNIVIIVHDYLYVCPTSFLVNDENKFCHVPTNIRDCYSCISKLSIDNYASSDIASWRASWANLFNACSEIIVFSKSSSDILHKTYPSISAKKFIQQDPLYKPKLRPQKRKKNKPRIEGLKIGVVGNMLPHKGMDFVQEIGSWVHENKIGSVTVIGGWHSGVSGSSLNVHGGYQQDELPDLIEKYDIDVILFPSICPETFSYTISEIIEMDMPVVSLDIGAQGERVNVYKYGKAITQDEFTLQSAFDGLWEMFELKSAGKG